jgi:hypothetical protein
MNHQKFVAGSIPERFVEVDAARLLLILTTFAHPIEKHVTNLRCYPPHKVAAYFTPEYYLQKLDFLLRYPDYFIYEIVELYRLGKTADIDRDEIITVVRSVLADNEPELMNKPFRRFWYGTYERLDDVEGWWYGRNLIYARHEPRTNRRPQKYYFLTDLAYTVADKLIQEVEHSRWYDRRVSILHRFFGHLSAAEVKQLQYAHPQYHEAQLNEMIPNISYDEIARQFTTVFNEPLESQDEYINQSR